MLRIPDQSLLERRALYIALIELVKNAHGDDADGFVRRLAQLSNAASQNPIAGIGIILECCET